MKTAQQIRNEAADLIERWGWVQGRFGNKAVGFCLGGAIYNVAGATDEETTQALNSVRSSLQWGNTPLSDYNDTPGRTKAEVLALLRSTDDSAS
jgi:dienelactone hydrolase